MTRTGCSIRSNSRRGASVIRTDAITAAAAARLTCPGSIAPGVCSRQVSVGTRATRREIWAELLLANLPSSILGDNAIGYTDASANFGHSACTSRVVDSLFVGETENIGNPMTPAEMEALRISKDGTGACLARPGTVHPLRQRDMALHRLTM